MAGVPIPATIITNDTFAVRPTGAVDDSLRVLFVHGGPGGGTAPMNARYFDPEAYRIVLVDQRGCGKSTPFAELEENTTGDLVADFEKVRQCSASSGGRCSAAAGAARSRWPTRSRTRSA